MRGGGWLERGAFLLTFGVFMTAFIGAGGLEGALLYASLKALLASLLTALAISLALSGCERVLQLSEKGGEQDEERGLEGGGGAEAD